MTRPSRNEVARAYAVLKAAKTNAIVKAATKKLKKFNHKQAATACQRTWNTCLQALPTVLQSRATALRARAIARSTHTHTNHSKIYLASCVPYGLF